MEVMDLIEPVYVIKPIDTIAHVRRLFLSKKINRVIAHDKKLLGIITEKDLARALENYKKPIDELTADKIMKKNLITAEPTESINNICKLMIEKKISGVPIKSNEEIMGLVTKDSIVKAFAQEVKGVVKVKDLMTRKVKTITEYHSILHAERLMEENNISRLVVIKDGLINGIITRRDIAFATIQPRKSKVNFIRMQKNAYKHLKILPLIVADAMRKEVKTIKEKEDASKAAGIMIKNRIGSLPVEEKGKLKGIITKTDFIKFLAKKGFKKE